MINKCKIFEIAINSTKKRGRHLVKILLDATFSDIQYTSSFLREQLHSKNVCENRLQHFSWSLWYSLQVIQSIVFLAHKVSLNTPFKLRKSLKRMPSLAYTELNQAKYRFSLIFALVCYSDIHTHIDM